MATTVKTEYPQRGIAVTTWAGVANGEQGLACSCTRWSDKTVQISGTFGAGGSVSIEGSNDGTNWAVTHDAQGNANTYTGDVIEFIAENPLLIRPNVTAGDGTTTLKVVIVGNKDDL